MPPITPNVNPREQTARSLVAIEYDFICLDTAFGELIARLQALLIPEGGPAAEEMVRLRYAVRSVLSRLAGPINEAVALAESALSIPAPF